MNIDTGGKVAYYYDMCAICNLNTAGQHEPDCPLYQGPGQRIIAEQLFQGSRESTSYSYYQYGNKYGLPRMP